MDSTTTVPQARKEVRSRIDGLTRSERQLLRDPGSFAVRPAGDGQWLLTVPSLPGVVFVARKLDANGSLEVVSNTHRAHTVDYHGRTCSCEDWAQRRAPGCEEEGTCCKHLAAAEAISHWADRKRQAQLEAAARKAAEEQRAAAALRAAQEKERAALASVAATYGDLEGAQAERYQWLSQELQAA